MRILHLEDDGPLREILAAALKATAPTCEIHQFVNSDDALRYATENVQGVDLFILDVRVPGSMNGLQVAEKLRAIHCPGVIVITSAYRAPDEAVLRELSCEWYPKPWHIFEATTKLMSMAQRKLVASPVTPAVPAADAPDVPSTPDATAEAADPPAAPAATVAAPVVPPVPPAAAEATDSPAVPAADAPDAPSTPDATVEATDPPAASAAAAPDTPLPVKPPPAKTKGSTSG
jgi:CheY-like chemotaxis protein